MHMRSTPRPHRRGPMLPALPQTPSAACFGAVPALADDQPKDHPPTGPPRRPRSESALTARGIMAPPAADDGVPTYAALLCMRQAKEVNRMRSFTSLWREDGETLAYEV